MSLLPLVPGAQSSIHIYISDHELWTKDFTCKTRQIAFATAVFLSDTKNRNQAGAVIDYDAKD